MRADHGDPGQRIEGEGKHAIVAEQHHGLGRGLAQQMHCIGTGGLEIVVRLGHV